MTRLMALDMAEVSTWLTRVAQTIDRSVREPARAKLLASLRVGVGASVGLSVLAQLALVDDCLRVAHLAIEADGATEPDELAKVADLVRVAATKYFAVLPVYEAFDDGVTTPTEVARFLRTHRADPGPFGFASPQTWRGLELVRAVASDTRNASPLREHERMLARVMESVFDGRATEIEQTARRRLRELFEPPPSNGLDPRAAAFVRVDGPEVFSSVAHGSHIHERDPFDAETIHGDVRAAVHRLVDRATTPTQAQTGHGVMQLVLGESGAGKTHLLRALRTQVHGQRLGYVGYLQMTSEVGDYTRYVLRSLIDSMERPYDAPVLAESGLMYLSDGLVEGRTSLSLDELEALRTAELSPPELERTVGRIVDRIVRTEGLEALEIDLVQALLLLQRRDPALQRRVVRFLRCEPLNAYDRELLGGLAPRDQPEDPLRLIRQLAAVMHELQMAALVIEVDQIEEALPDGQTVARLQQAFDSLRAIADAVPSAVVVISCLDDVYEAVKPKLARALVDRLELQTPVVRLAGRRQRDEIELMLVKRLEYLYGAFDVGWRDDDPIYPFQGAQLDAVTQLRARDGLAYFRSYHAACIAAAAIVPPTSAPAAAPVPSPVASPAAPASLERQWQEAMTAASVAPLPDTDDAMLALVTEGVRGAAAELSLAAQDGAVANGRAQLFVKGQRYLLAACNRGAQGGHLAKQLQALQAQARSGGAIAVAVRNGDWQFSPKTATSTSIGNFVRDGGRIVALADGDLRAITAMRAVTAARPDGLDAWRAEARPLAQLAVVRDVLGLGAVMPGAAAPPAERAPQIERPVPPPPPPVAAPAPASARISLGVTTSMRAEPIGLDVEQITTHVAFLGSTGSGKTTAALSVVEQLLERGVSVLLVDRKGDLAAYADDAWWRDPAAPEAARRAALRDRIDVGLYTPGNPQGRPLRLPLIPLLGDLSPQEREQLARFAADGLAAMMGYGSGQRDKHKISVLQCAIELLEEGQVTIENLQDTIDRPDPDLLRKVSALQRHFASLSEDLQTLKIQRGALLAGAGEVFDIGALLPPLGGRPRLSIINTSALGEINVINFWISRVLVELSRLGRKRPSRVLQAAAFFDEADLYVPALRSPPTKEPMFDLLKRSRSTGIGVLLATQNPGDFDYKARDTINTWLVGKVSQSTAIGKMRALIGSYPNVEQRLASQSTGHFFVLTTGSAVEVRCHRSLMQTVQKSEAEVAELASRTR